MSYFTWKGKTTDEMHVLVDEYPDIIRPKLRASYVSVPGSPGYLTQVENDNAYDSTTRTAICTLMPEGDIEDVCTWLIGSGSVVFGNEPTYAYKARIDNQIEFAKILRNTEHRTFAVPFLCQPFKYLATPAANIEKTVSGQTITNPGTVSSAPIIKVEGSGDITLSVGGSYVELEGITGGIIIDSDVQDCFTLDRGALLNDKMTGDFPLILPGTSTVSWTGTVTKITITPNWRWL